MVVRVATLLLGALEGVGPKKSRFSGPTSSDAPRNDVARLKNITYRAIKTTVTLIVILEFAANYILGDPPCIQLFHWKNS